jgi:hypothetical protein
VVTSNPIQKTETARNHQKGGKITPFSIAFNIFSFLARILQGTKQQVGGLNYKYEMSK